MKKKFVLKQFKVGNDWLYAPATYFVDSYAPYVEKIHLNETSTIPESLEFELSYSRSGSKLNSGFLNRVIGFFNKKAIACKSDHVYIDLRVNSPSNISHSIMMQLPIVLIIEKLYQKELKGKKLKLILPKNIPIYIKTLFSSLGYELLITDNDVKANFITFSIKFWPSLRGQLVELFRESIVNKDFLFAVQEKSQKFTKQIFLSRRDSRKIINENEIENLLIKKGYTKVYIEDYELLDQVAMVSHAESIIAIHGAALGLMTFRALFDLPPINLIEIFPPSHMTNVYRILTHQLNGNWMGVRGRLWESLIPLGYENARSGAIRKYSLNDFYVCEKSVMASLEMIKKS